MSFNAFPLVVGWSVLAFVVLALAAYKGVLATRSSREGIPHLFDMQGSQQSHVASTVHREEMIEKWGKILTVLVVLSGLVIATLYVLSRIDASSTRVVG